MGQLVMKSLRLPAETIGKVAEIKSKAGLDNEADALRYVIEKGIEWEWLTALEGSGLETILSELKGVGQLNGGKDIELVNRRIDEVVKAVIQCLCLIQRHIGGQKEGEILIQKSREDARSMLKRMNII